MDEFGDLMMDFTIEHEHPTGQLFLDALDAFPGREREVRGWFESWVWINWCDANLPEREPTPEELAADERWVEEATRRFLDRLHAVEKV